MAETFRISEENQENISNTIDFIRSEMESNSYETLNRIIENPISYFRKAGMNQTIRKWFNKFPNLIGFQRSMRSAARKMLERMKNAFNDCQQCIIGILYMLWVIRAALRYENQDYANFEDAFVELLEKSWIGMIILGSGLLVKGVIEPIARTFGFDWRPQKIAQYICFKIGICPNPFVY
jgi:hypothetical protein